MDITQGQSQINEFFRKQFPLSWPALEKVAEPWLHSPNPETLLPLLACEAVGGKWESCVPVASASLAALLHLRFQDDLQDQDHASRLDNLVGRSRAYNLAAAFQSLAFHSLAQAPYGDPLRTWLMRRFSSGFLQVQSGQDLDLSGTVMTLAEYWLIAELKTGAAFATIAECGARVGSVEPAHLKAMRSFGHYLGLAMQALNDFEGIWKPKGIPDLERGKVTLPLVYAMNVQHDAQDRLRALVQSGQVAAHAQEIKAVLSQIDAQGYTVWVALNLRGEALAALPQLDNPGVKKLAEFIDAMFADIDSLLELASAPMTEDQALSSGPEEQIVVADIVLPETED